MKYNHLENKKLLVAKGIVNSEDIFDYSVSDPYKVVEQFFQFCQQNLSEECGKYDIQPALIYIRSLMDVNAAAGKGNDHYVIRVNFGTILIMFRLYTDHRHIFNEDALGDFTELNKSLDESLDYLLFQVSMQFTFFHERAHLIQKSPVEHQWVDENYNLNPEDAPFSLSHHIREFDADIHASTFVAFHLVDYWKRQSDKIRTKENLEFIISIGLAGVLAYFLFLKRNYAKVYYKAGTHPHPLIRISYILDNLVKTADGNIDVEVDFSSNNVLKNAFRIVEQLFSVAETPWLNQFIEDFYAEQENIKKYINDTLIAESLHVPELTINRET